MNPLLYHEEQGNSASPSVICLHGLLGSSRNWRGVARSLAQNYRIFTLDLRNHGQSFHSDDTGVDAMVDDILQWMDHHKIHRSHLCGHSLGGKVVMKMACMNPDRVQSLIVGDIAPRDYPEGHHIPTLDALLSLDLEAIKNRKEADILLMDLVPHWAFRQFLLTNLDFVEGQACWIPNLKVLRESMALLSQNPLQASDHFAGPSLFVRGGNSGYVRSEHFDDIYRFFPKSTIETMDGVGHDVHVENRALFVNIIQSFLA